MMDAGELVIKCVRSGGHELNGFGGYSFSENEEVDLCSDTTDSRLQATYITARLMVSDATEIKQAIMDGYLVVVSTRPPDRSRDA